MTPYLLGTLSVFGRLLFAIPVLIILLRLFSRTQMKSFLWLIAALIVWPLLAAGSSFMVPLFTTQFAAARGLAMRSTISILSGFYLVEALIGGALLLIAVYMLSRDLEARMERPTPPPVPAR